MLLEEIVRTSAEVGATRSRLNKVGLLAETLRRVAPAEAGIAVAYLSGTLPQGSIGIGWATLRALPPPADVARLDLIEVDAAWSKILANTGPGSQATRRAIVVDIFGRATQPEQRFLVALLAGELRQGAL